MTLRQYEPLNISKHFFPLLTSFKHDCATLICVSLTLTMYMAGQFDMVIYVWPYNIMSHLPFHITLASFKDGCATLICVSLTLTITMLSGLISPIFIYFRSCSKHSSAQVYLKGSMVLVKSGKALKMTVRH